MKKIKDRQRNLKEGGTDELCKQETQEITISNNDNGDGDDQYDNNDGDNYGADEASIKSNNDKML